MAISGANLEGTGMGYDKEIEAIHLANEIDLFTSPYVFDPDQAVAMAKAGADQPFVAHVGLTTSGSIGAAVALTLDEAIDKVMAIAEAGRSVRKDILVICHGGPFDEPQSVGVALKRMQVLVVSSVHPASNVCLPSADFGQVEAFKKMDLA